MWRLCYYCVTLWRRVPWEPKPAKFPRISVAFDSGGSRPRSAFVLRAAYVRDTKDRRAILLTEGPKAMGSGAAKSRGSWNRFQRVSGFRKLVLLVGSLGPLGWFPASGTLTVAAVGVPLYWCSRALPSWAWITLTVAVALGAVAIHQAGDRWLGESDSRMLVWDEVVGFMVAVIGVPWSWQLAVLAFVLERGLDVSKCWPGNIVERRWPGGWGVVGDDVVAGVYTCLALHAAIRLVPGALGVG